MRDEVPVAFVVPRPDAAGDTNLAGSVMTVCRRELADFKVPREVRIVTDLPRSALAKVAKHELRRSLREGTSNGRDQ
jgi:crotonobetaine/carnitine-CoA ligase